MKSDDSSRDTQLRCTNVKPWMFSGNFALSKRVTLRKITKFSQFWLTHLFHHPVGHTCRHIFSKVRYNKSNLKAIIHHTSHLFLLQFHAFSCIFLYSDNKEYSTARCCYQSIRCKWLCINLDHSSTNCFLIRPPLLFIKVTTGERSREGGNLTSPIVWNAHWTPNSGRNIRREEVWLAAHTHNFL